MARSFVSVARAAHQTGAPAGNPISAAQYACHVADDVPLDAGRFSEWLESMLAALDGARDADVPCDECTACCRSSQFVHIAPDETDALAHVPSALLFPAPGHPPGPVLLGYDERGHCPMLVDDRCSIYEHRPRTCRTYDCRVFAAAGVEPDPERQSEVLARVRRWRFAEPTEHDRAARDAVRAAAQDGDERDPVQRAVQAIRRVTPSSDRPA
jgi:Fe-S-cluster containining protein